MSDLQRGTHLGHLLAGALARHPRRPVLHIGGQALTGRDLADDISRYVAALEGLGHRHRQPGRAARAQPPGGAERSSAPDRCSGCGVRRSTRSAPLEDHAYVLHDAGIETLIVDPTVRRPGQGAAGAGARPQAGPDLRARPTWARTCSRWPRQSPPAPLERRRPGAATTSSASPTPAAPPATQGRRRHRRARWRR